MNRSRKLLFAAAIFGTAIFGSTQANATDIDVSATMTASAAVTVANNANIDFGGIDFVAGANSGTLELGPDGNAAAGGGSVNLTPTGTATAGLLNVTSNAGTIEVSCDATAIISDGTRALNITAVVWDQSAAAAYGAATNTCAGLGAGAVAINTAVTNDPAINIGAELTIGANALDGSGGGTPYDTATGTGDPISFRLVFQ